MARPNVADQLVDEVESLHLNRRGYPASSFQEALATVIEMAQPEELEEKGLTVETAYPNDSGRNLARMHPDTLEQLSIEPGAAVEITGDPTTVATAREMEGGAAHRGAVRIDGFTRENAGVEVGENVVIRPIEVEPAARVVLDCTDEDVERLGDEPLDHVRGSVRGRVVSTGDTLPIAEPEGTPSDTPGRAVPLTVANIDPELGRARIDEETEVVLERE